MITSVLEDIPIDFEKTEFGISIVSRDEQLKNVFCSIAFNEEGNLISLSDLHPLKELSSILVIDDGRLISVKEEHS